SMASKGKRDAERSCVLCCQELEIFALGKCDHSVCYRCSTKMRVLCEQRYCAVCREELDKVVFIKKLAPFSTIATHQFQCEKKYDICFADGKVHTQFRKLLQHECPVCPEMRPFNTFEELEHHMRKQHELFCCKLCVKHLKIFTYERKWYNRKDLARHRIHGDPDDTSHRGHPLCKFCDDRYLDNDELLKHLRRDHYFCHFCDSEGAQEYYSFFFFFLKNFKRKVSITIKNLCIIESCCDQLDFFSPQMFSGPPKLEKKSSIIFIYFFKGVVSGNDYDEVDRFNRHARLGRGGSRGGQQNKRGSWRYNREEEDRDVAAAVRASVAARRQEQKHQLEEKEATNIQKEEMKENEDTRNFKSTLKSNTESTGPKESNKPVTNNGPLKRDDFPALAAAAVVAPLPTSSAAKPASVELKEEDFPSLSMAKPSISTGLTPAYNAPARKASAFQEEDFPALVSKIKPQKSFSTTTSAWTNNATKSVVRNAYHNNSPSLMVKKPSPVNNTKASNKNKKTSLSDDESDDAGMTAQEIRSAPTMLDISSMLTTSTMQTVSKVGRKKKVGGTEKQSSVGPPPSFSDTVASSSQKENVPDMNQTLSSKVNANSPVTVNTELNGHVEKMVKKNAYVAKEPPGFKTPVVTDPCPLPEEDFPALGNPILPPNPPPGFTNVLPLKTVPASLPPLPPGLSVPVSKPPPGFTGIPSNTNVPEPVIPATNQPIPCTYLIPDNFQQRNIELIQSIKKYLQNDESKFNEFKTYSGQFRQGLITAAQYHKSCRELLGENFKKIFNELLVLLPDTTKQQELLAAHNDLRVLEKQSSNKCKKNKKNAWQTNLNSDLDCQVCPTCKQVLTQKDFITHKSLHTQDDEFPSLQAISKIIS
uniref:RING-type E3 ubiquitin transferase n=1 Tax=Latimeria chalumnae TaxID=7897 RepID=H3ALQ0_LATCH